MESWINSKKVNSLQEQDETTKKEIANESVNE
jgi:hypothetical protein